MKKFVKSMVMVTLAIAMSLMLVACNDSNNQNGNTNPTKLSAIGYMSVDINPSMELTFDSNGKVATVKALNEDANIMLVDVNLVGLTAEEATEKITELAEKMGYLSDTNTNVKLLAACDTPEDEAALLKKAKKGAEQGSSICKVVETSTILEREVKKLQQTNPELYKDLTPAKLRLIKTVMQFDKAMTIESGSALTVKELSELVSAEHERIKEYISDEIEDKYEKIEEELSAEIQAKIDALYGSEYASLISKFNALEKAYEQLENAAENAAISEEDILKIMQLLNITDRELLTSGGVINEDSIEEYLESIDITDENEEELENTIDEIMDILDAHEDSQEEGELSAEAKEELKKIVGTDVTFTSLDDVDEYLDTLEEEAEELKDSVELTAELEAELEKYEEELDSIEKTVKKQMKEEIKQLKEEFKKTKQQKLEITAGGKN